MSKLARCEAWLREAGGGAGEFGCERQRRRPLAVAAVVVVGVNAGWMNGMSREYRQPHAVLGRLVWQEKKDQPVMSLQMRDSRARIAAERRTPGLQAGEERKWWTGMIEERGRSGRAGCGYFGGGWLRERERQGAWCSSSALRACRALKLGSRWRPTALRSPSQLGGSPPVRL